MSSPLADAVLRYELKLICEAPYLSAARAWVRMHPEGFRIAYSSRWVNNLYLDTPQLNSFNANLEGVAERQKLRLRWYGKPGPQQASVTSPTLELKYKRNLLGGKRQQVLDCLLAWERPYAHLLATIQQVAAPEWQQWLTPALQPTLINCYHREYYVTVDGALRATLDYHQSAYDQRLVLRPNMQHPLLMPDFVVIELKAFPEHIERLQWAIGRFPIPRSRHSKYITGLLSGTA